jgi:hypothetical protein
MKKLVVSLLAFTGFLFPLCGQVDHDQRPNESIPVESLILKKEQVPDAIVKAVNSDFATGEAFKWGKFPYILEKYGWVIESGAAGQSPDRYEVNIKATDGSDIYAIYSADGTIIQSRTVRKNASLPYSVSLALGKSQYKDWTVVGDKELIKYWNSKNDIEEHFRITVEKNNVKKSISFNYKEPASNQ